jgi:hypothetical protein
VHDPGRTGAGVSEKPPRVPAKNRKSKSSVRPTHGAADLNAEAGSSELVAKPDSAAQLER